MPESAKDQGIGIGRFSPRAAWLAWSLCAVCVVLITLTLLLDFITESAPIFRLPGERPAPLFALLTGVLSLAYPTVGALIASRLPTNPIGWIFCCIGLIHNAQRLTIAYADYALLENLALPWGEFSAWLSTWLGFANPSLIVFLILLFPDGRLPSPRWRIVAWAAICGAALTALGVAFWPGSLLLHVYVDNPFEVVGVIGGGFTTYDLFGASKVFGMTLLLISNLAALLSLVARLRRARRDERQQLKWFLFAAVPTAIFLSLVILDLIVANFTADFLFRSVHIAPSWQVFRTILYMSVFALLLVPVCTYVAILKHRLYEIDIIINRTLVYGSLTVVIAGIFGAVDALVHHLLLTLTHQESIASIVIAAFVIAVLFDPIKHRIKRFIDRRIFGEGRNSQEPNHQSEGGTTA